MNFRGCAGGEKLRRLSLISIDLLFVASATVIAVVLRANFDTVPDSLRILMPYIFISIGCAFVVFFVAGLDRTPWRYSSVADHLQVAVLTVLAIVLALVLTFTIYRLEGVARALPVIQGGLIASILVSARSAPRFWHRRQRHTMGIPLIDEQRSIDAASKVTSEKQLG